MKRIFDLLISIFGLIILSPLLLISLFFVWKQDFHSPFYIAKRVGKKDFLLILLKLDQWS